MRSVFTFLFLCILSAPRVIHSFTMPTVTIVRRSTPACDRTLRMAPKDPSRSGTKTDRMDRLAEMEKLGTATDGDNSVFIKAAGGFFALIVIAIAAAASSGLLTQY